MRTILIVTIGALALCGCATPSQREAAIRQCQAVGISTSDPQFELCTRAYALQANQDALEVTYRRALNPTYENPRIGHAWHGF